MISLGTEDAAKTNKTWRGVGPHFNGYHGGPERVSERAERGNVLCYKNYDEGPEVTVRNPGHRYPSHSSFPILSWHYDRVQGWTFILLAEGKDGAVLKQRFSAGMPNHLGWLLFIDVSENFVTSIIRAPCFIAYHFLQNRLVLRRYLQYLRSWRRDYGIINNPFNVNTLFNIICLYTEIYVLLFHAIPLYFQILKDITIINIIADKNPIRHATIRFNIESF